MALAPRVYAREYATVEEGYEKACPDTAERLSSQYVTLSATYSRTSTPEVLSTEKNLNVIRLGADNSNRWSVAYVQGSHSFWVMGVVDQKGVTSPSGKA